LAPLLSADPYLLAANLLDPCGAVASPVGNMGPRPVRHVWGEHKLRAGQKVVTRVRVVVADDDLLLREGLASLLDRSGFDVVGQAGDGNQLVALVREAKPDLVVADIRMPPHPYHRGARCGAGDPRGVP